MRRILLVITDRRFVCLRLTLEAMSKYLHGAFDDKIIVDDSADSEFQNQIHYHFSNYQIYSNPQNRGFGLTMARAWELVRDSGCDYVFNLQNDFMFTCHVNMNDMQSVLEAHPNMGQMSLRRQPVSAAEKAAGGFVELHPEAYEEKEWQGHHWLDHNQRFTMNPALIPAWVARQPWPTPPYCESQFGVYMREQGYREGIWGKIDDPPMVEHIGTRRTRVGGY